MDTKALVSAPSRRTYRRHSSEFKAQVIAACQQPGVSIAAVAQANGLNANFLRHWLKAYRAGQQAVQATPAADTPAADTPASAAVTTLVPVSVQTAGDIQIEIRRQQTVVQIAWPASQAASCAQWLRDLLK